MTSDPHAEEYRTEAQVLSCDEVTTAGVSRTPLRPGSSHATTILRGVCILIIVVHHYFRLGSVANATVVGAWLAQGGHLAVAGFLALSGFGLERATRTRPLAENPRPVVVSILLVTALLVTLAVNHVMVWPIALAAVGVAAMIGPTRPLLGRRWARLTPPLVAAAFLVSAPVALMVLGPTRAALWFTVATGGWFIRFLWLQYLAYHLGHTLTEKRAAVVTLVLVGLAAVAIAATGDPYSASFALAFPLGMFVGRMEEPPRSRTLFAFSLLPLAVVLGGMTARVAPLYELLQPTLMLVSGVSAAGLFIARLAAPAAVALIVLGSALSPLANRSRFGPFARSLTWLGEASLGIYLANVALMPLFRKLPPSVAPLISFTLVVVASVVLGYCVAWVGSRVASRPSRSSS